MGEVYPDVYPEVYPEGCPVEGYFGKFGEGGGEGGYADHIPWQALTGGRIVLDSRDDVRCRRTLIDDGWN